MSALDSIPRIGRYILLEQLPSRGLYESHIARRWNETEFSYLRCLHPNLEGDATAEGRFLRQLALARYLDHRNILELQGVSQEQGRVVVAYRFFPAVSLRRLITEVKSRGDHLPLEVFVYIAQRLFRALKHAHAAVDDKGRALNLIHRELSPENVLLGFAGEVKISDWGTARAEIGRFQTAVGSAVGNLQYMSPEVALGAAGDQRIDVYGLGTLLYELATLSPLIEEAGRAEMLDAITSRKGVPFPVRMAVGGAVQGVISGALEILPEDRPESIEAFHEAFRETVSEVPQLTAEQFAQYLKERLPRQEGAAQAQLEQLRARSAGYAHTIDQVGYTKRVRDAFHEEEATVVYDYEDADDPDDIVYTMPGTFVAQDGASVEEVKDEYYRKKFWKEVLPNWRFLVGAFATTVLVTVIVGLSVLPGRTKQPELPSSGAETSDTSASSSTSVEARTSVRVSPLASETKHQNTRLHRTPKTKRRPGRTSETSVLPPQKTPVPRTLARLQRSMKRVIQLDSRDGSLQEAIAAFEAYCRGQEGECSSKTRSYLEQAGKLQSLPLLRKAFRSL